LRAINWLKGNIAPDGATYDVDPIIVDFGEVEPGKSDTIEMKIISTGKLDLVLEEIDFWENPDDVFEIISGKITNPITLNRGQSHSVKIRFTPKEKIGYKGSLSIKSNALYQEYRYIEVWGYGGGIQAKGPILTTNFPENLIDFGKVKKPTSKIIELVLKNIGDQTLEISEFKIDTTYKDYKRFDFAQVLQTPIYIEPGDSVKVKVRFSAATDEERVYNARIRVVTNAKENKEFYIELRGEVEGLIFVDGENNLSSPVKIISNPLSQTIEVQFNNLTLNKPVSISVFNNLSQNIETLNFQPEEIVRNHINLDLNNLPSGAYYIIVRTNGEQFVFPFVLVR